jgi:hypothetical protein
MKMQLIASNGFPEKRLHTQRVQRDLQVLSVSDCTKIHDSSARPVTEGSFVRICRAVTRAPTAPQLNISFTMIVCGPTWVGYRAHKILNPLRNEADPLSSSTLILDTPKDIVQLNSIGKMYKHDLISTQAAEYSHGCWFFYTLRTTSAKNR